MTPNPCIYFRYLVFLYFEEYQKVKSMNIYTLTLIKSYTIHTQYCTRQLFRTFEWNESKVIYKEYNKIFQVYMYTISLRVMSRSSVWCFEPISRSIDKITESPPPPLRKNIAMPISNTMLKITFFYIKHTTYKRLQIFKITQ